MNIEPLLGIFGIDSLPMQLIQVIETIKTGSAEMLTYFFIYFIIGFFMYSTLYAVVGAICSSEEEACLLYTSPSPRDRQKSRMPSSA